MNKVALVTWIIKASTVAGVVVLLLCAGCIVRGPLTLNIFASRMAMALPNGTNYTVTASATTSGGAVGPTSVLTGLDTNAWKAIADGAGAGAKLP